ncbi:hypothetical protein QVD17_02429 [Tagetes erecta]|uniref:ZCF37 n=1 Tax=Tagetes erecta TaxID=13708 RepID=A0AAD8LDX3_TARER|nr:hypothetical protein QVD17_02429 [Tagetes erecta]
MRRNRFCCKRNKEKKNPYSTRGLDKFEALLAELEDKKRKIFTQKGSHYISFVRFVYSNSNDVKPIIVRLKDPKKPNSKTSLPKSQAPTLDHHHNSKLVTKTETKGLAHHEGSYVDKVTNLKTKLKEWWMASYNLPLFVMLVIMILLTLFGRSLAIICTSITWYLIPKIDGINTSTKKMIKNQRHLRKPSENSYPKPFYSGPINYGKQNSKMKKLTSF